jgi:hypothetical protein
LGAKSIKELIDDPCGPLKRLDPEQLGRFLFFAHATSAVPHAVPKRFEQLPSHQAGHPVMINDPDWLTDVLLKAI